MHDFPFLHWDLLLEAGESCWTWRLLNCPESDRGIPAERLPDHRLHYLDYEGPISGNRGKVSRWDGGELYWLEANPDRVRCLCLGQKQNSRLLLHSDPESDHWLAEFQTLETAMVESIDRYLDGAVDSPRRE